MPKNIYEQIEEDMKALETEKQPKGNKTDEEQSEPTGDDKGGGEGTEQAKPESGDEGKPEDAAEGAEGGDGKTTSASDDGAEKTGDAKEAVTHAAMARLRREKRELKARLAQAEAEKAQPADPVEPVKAEEKKQEPNREDDPVAWAAWKAEQTENKLQEVLSWRERETQEREQAQTVNDAVEELQGIVNEYKAERPDFDAAMAHAGQKYTEALRIMHPDATEKQIKVAIQQQILAMAAQFAAQGANPAEALYDMAIERFGYDPDASKPQEKPASGKPNLKVVAENKRRSATGLGSGGSGSSAPLTAGALDSMTNGQIARLTPEQLAQLEAAS